MSSIRDSTGEARVIEEPNASIDRRRAPRVKAIFEASYSAGRGEGNGYLVEISCFGASVAAVSVRPEIGTSLRIHVFVHDGAPVELIGRVARHTPEGFAVEFEEELVSDVRQFVDEAAALANAMDGLDQGDLS